MKNLKFIRQNNSVSKHEISFVETELGIEFPKSYRDFLLKYNGGLSEEGVFDIPNRGHSSIIFYGINTKNDYSDLLINYKAYKDRLPKNVIPIGFDPGGNLVCILMLIDGHKLYFWDHEVENNPPSLTKMFWIGDDFSNFVDSLQKEDTEVW